MQIILSFVEAIMGYTFFIYLLKNIFNTIVLVLRLIGIDAAEGCQGVLDFLNCGRVSAVLFLATSPVRQQIGNAGKLRKAFFALEAFDARVSGMVRQQTLSIGKTCITVFEFALEYFLLCVTTLMDYLLTFCAKFLRAVETGEVQLQRVNSRVAFQASR